MFLHLNARVKRLRRIIFENRNSLLNEDGARIRARINKMDCHTGDLAAIIKRLSPAMHTREGRQKRRMDIDDAIGEGLQETLLHNSHKACEDNRIDARFLEPSEATFLGGALELCLEWRAIEVARG